MLFFLFPQRVHGHMSVQEGSMQEWVLSQGWDLCAHTPAGELCVQGSPLQEEEQPLRLPSYSAVCSGIKCV